MDNLNNIPNEGNWGDAASKLNDNFNKVKQAVTTVENTTKNNKGYFTSLSALNTAFPSPKAGQTAYVYDEASSTNYYIYNAVNGAWVTSSVEAPSVGVDIAGYTKTGGSTKTTQEIDDTKANHGYADSPKTLKQVDDSVSQLADDAVMKLTNPITNGNFVNGTTGWSFRSNISGVSASSGVLSFTGGGALNATTSNWIRQIRLDMFPIGHILYNIVTARSLMEGRFYVGIGHSLSTFDLTDQWGTYSHLASATSNYPTYGAALGETVEMTNAMCFDLTGIFGEGNEPTKEEMDLLISTLGIDYFEGEITIPTQKIMQWQLKLSITKGEDMLLNERYAYVVKEFNDDGIVSSATVFWEDGTSGILTFSDYNDDWQAYDSYEITFGDKTLVQPKVARDEQGNIIDKPLKNIQ